MKKNVLRKERETKNGSFSSLGLVQAVTLLLFFLLFSENSAAQCTPPGNEASYGTNSWIGYVYATVSNVSPPSDAFTATYRGYITKTESFDYDLGSGAISGGNLCGTYSDRFAVRYRMRKTLTAGYYTFTVGGDDGYRLSVDGGSTYIINNWGDHSYTSSTQTVYLSGTTYFVLDYYEQGGLSRLSFAYTSCTSSSTAPTSISGSTNLCSTSGGTSLAAVGGTHASGATYQWGTGSVVGNNIISGQTNSTYYVNPSTTTTYWVRRVDASPCNIPTEGVTLTVDVATRSTQPTTMTGGGTVCSGSPVTLTVSGGTHGTNAVYEWGVGYSGGVNIIPGETGSSITIYPTVTSGYWVRRVDSSPCNYATGQINTTVTVTGTSTAPTSISGASELCSGSGTNLTAVGGTTGTNGRFQWGTGSVIGSNIISGQTNSTYYVNPTTTTTYWVRRVDSSPCTSTTDGVTHTITVITPSTIVSSISGGGTVCSGSEVTLTANGGTLGTNSEYQWGTGNSAGSNILVGETEQSITVNPTATTTYWVRRIDTETCLSTTGQRTTTVTIAAVSTAPTTVSGTATICAGNSTTLTASGGTLVAGGSYQWGTGSEVGENILSTQTSSSFVVSPTETTTYWVRRIDNPCTNITAGKTYTVTVATRSTAPTSITSSTTTVCSGTAIALTAEGGTHAATANYQWGTGSVIGSNVISGQTNSTYTPSPTATTTYWVRRVDVSPCAGYTTGVTLTITVATNSIASSNITGNYTICAGDSTTLTSSGGTLTAGSSYQWGTGSVVGENIIDGENAISITVSPSTTTVYWLRKINPAVCGGYTAGITRTVVVSIPSTAPTGITSSNSITCAGQQTTLTAIGGVLSSGASYQWGTGSVIGSNIISGQTSVSINVAPTATTTYWVRIKNTNACSTYTDGVTKTVTIDAPPGNPATFGNNVWNAYGYSTGDITLATAVYAGYYTVSTLGIDTQTGTNSWANTTSPSNAAGWMGCTVPNDNFTFVAKRKGFPCGNYNLIMQNWDDASQLYLNGTLIWSNGTWNGGGNSNLLVGNYALDASSEIEVRFRENNGLANINLDIVNTTVTTTAPTSITGNTTSCAGSTVTLTANGGVLGTNGTYEWGTGTTVGSNKINGQSNATLTVAPTTTTTYWVRRKQTLCSVDSFTAGVTFQIVVSQPTIAGSITTTVTTICKNSTPKPIILSGNTGTVVKWQSADNAGFTVNVIDYTTSNTTLTSEQIGSIATTKYFRAVIKNGVCTTEYSNTIQITVPTTITYNGTWSGTPNENTPVVISSNLTLTSDITACSCEVTNNAVLTVPADRTLTIKENITTIAPSTIIVEDKGSLVQINDAAVNTGVVTVKRRTTPLKQFDYTYWSSPLAGQVLSTTSSPSIYYMFNPSINNWENKSASTVMTAGQGYISRAPSNLNYSTPQTVLATFNGALNNGVINAPIIKGAGTFNLIGNPYPSAIDIDLFLLDLQNQNVVNGTIYLWTHNTAIANTVPGNTAIFNYTRDDYAKYNITGGVKTASSAVSGGVTPNGKIASGQGFFIEANTNAANGTYAVQFNNSMRIAGNNNQFFRTSVAAATPSSVIEKNRVWVKLTNATGAYDEMLLGYISGATNDFDNLYDGKTFPAGNVVSIYSRLDNLNLAIQGRALPFNASEIIPLGYNSTIAGDFSIAIENLDGFFENQNVYLFDKSNQTYHDLKQNPFTFTSAIGTFNDRFELRFANQTLGIETPDTIAFSIIKNESHITIQSEQELIQSVTVFDITGKMLYTEKEINRTVFNTKDFNLAPQVLIVKVTFEEGITETKKLLFH